MVDFSDLQLNGREPVYMQIVTHVKRKILSGEARDGEPLPSRRELAGALCINPNTVQKAYKLMEEAGFVQTPRNAASHICAKDATIRALEEELGAAFVRRFIQEARANHLTYRAAIELISRYWED